MTDIGGRYQTLSNIFALCRQAQSDTPPGSGREFTQYRGAQLLAFPAIHDFKRQIYCSLNAILAIADSFSSGCRYEETVVFQSEVENAQAAWVAAVALIQLSSCPAYLQHTRSHLHAKRLGKHSITTCCEGKNAWDTYVVSDGRFERSSRSSHPQ